MAELILGFQVDPETRAEVEEGLDIYPVDVLAMIQELGDPEMVEAYDDEDISNILTVFHEVSAKLIAEAMRRGHLQDVMNMAMKLDGAPKED